MSPCRNATDISYGYKPEPNIFQALNHYVIIAKYHIFLSQLNKTSPSLEIFSFLLTEKILCERTIAFKNNTLRKFRAKWTTIGARSAPDICLKGCAIPTISFSFYFYFGVFWCIVSNISSLSHVSILTSVRSVSSVSIVCGSNLIL